MADIFHAEKRSEIMSKIRGKDTEPELRIRRALHSLGYRYRIHDPSLPGKPDMKLTKYNAIIQIHGCFWHGHDCHLFSMPESRKDFWKNKIEKNKQRDQKNIEQLSDLGWRQLIIWECALKGKHRLDEEAIITMIEDWLSSSGKFMSINGNQSP